MEENVTHPKLAKFFEQQKKRESEKRKQILLSLGLYDENKREYSPNNEGSKEYPNSEWDTVNRVWRYYRNVPIEVTDEEYEEILKNIETLNNSVAVTSSNSPIPNILTAIAWIIFIGGFIIGIVMGIEMSRYDFEWTIAFMCWFISLVNGMLMLSIAKVIQLLQEIRDKQ